MLSKELVLDRHRPVFRLFFLRLGPWAFAFKITAFEFKRLHATLAPWIFWTPGRRPAWKTVNLKQLIDYLLRTNAHVLNYVDI